MGKYETIFSQDYFNFCCLCIICILQELIYKMCRITIFIYNPIKYVYILRICENPKIIFKFLMKGIKPIIMYFRVWIHLL